jgi:formate-dependent nitrite reductase membrane component NrfD
MKSDAVTTAEEMGSTTYYDRPVLQEPVWIWAVPAYFYVGGAAGAAAVLGAAAQATRHDGLRGLVRRCRWISAVGTTVGAVLLVADLGRPERFLNMLRVFRPTSAMSMGSWTLAAAGALGSGAALFSDRRGAARAVGDASGLAAGAIGLSLSGYTAVLLSDTAVPLWRHARRSLPFLFVASAMTSAASILQAAELSDEEEKAVRVFDVLGGIAESAAIMAVERDVAGVTRVGDALQAGLGGSLWRLAKIGSTAGLVLSLLPGRGRARNLVSAAVGTATGLGLKFAIFFAGKTSARDPRATFEPQRAGEA